MKRIYIAGSINADNAIDVFKNCHRMIKTGNEVSKLGYAVFVPCLDVIWQIQTGDVDYDRIFKNSQPWLECSDAVVLTPEWENSPGTKKEIETAKKLNIPVFKKVEILEWFFSKGKEIYFNDENKYNRI